MNEEDRFINSFSYILNGLKNLNGSKNYKKKLNFALLNKTKLIIETLRSSF
ncbi:Uncharacterised protein [Chryseobacterium gleum]|uniref:Uncharacterized protein n=2 Tax=Chryseobacterium gleum TaxID=250 RepID=A0A3S5E2S2_CHRGE|nr:hypothetical protein HMPREF0204_12726 [Chryseobacterium gleum ATCC 35910]VEE06614.1 Uncharacterised protein [Chryseobacterium gleum]